MIGTFPPDHTWHPVGAEILSWFWTLTHPCFPPQVEMHYAAASDASQAYGLTLLATQSTPEASASIVNLIQKYPLPRRLPPRFFWEINKRHAAIGPQLFPQLLRDAGPHLGDVMNFMNVCLEAGTLLPGALAPVSDWASGETTRLLELVEPLQRDVGTRWRWDEDYQPKRTHLGVFLDLLGIIPGVSMEACVRAAQLKDPLCAFFAVVSMLKKRLLYPSELGYEPTRIELMAKVSRLSEENEKTEVVMFLWKVSREDGRAFAAASGPYEANGPIGPLSGGDPFSNFTDWDSRTADEHLSEIVETLDQWRVEWREGPRR